LLILDSVLGSIIVKRSGQASGRVNSAARWRENILLNRRFTILFVGFLIAGSILVGIIFQRNFLKTTAASQNGIIAETESPGKTTRRLAELLDLSVAELERSDIARMNLLCAESLPGAEKLNVDEMLATLDAWAQHIKSEIDRNFHHYGEDPAYFYNSTNFYKMAMMGVVLYEDYNIRYDPKWMAPPGLENPDDHFFADSRDILIYGLVGDQHLGTCSSMPVLYIALGRRLGYPLKLVKAKGHLFMRWDSPTEKFDMEATSKGVHYYDDEEYKKWPFPLSETDIKEEDYLRSLSAKEELSVFLSIRGACQTEGGQLGDALASCNLACKYAPTWKGNQVMLAQARARLARPVMLVQQQQPMNPNIPADPSPTPQNRLPNQIQTP
jgi:hypothetical protein